MKKVVVIFITCILSAQVYNVGDVVADFSGPICANGEGQLSLFDYNGEVNGGDYHVIWINLFTSW